MVNPSEVNNDPFFYTVDEFAKILRVHPNTIRRMIKNGRIVPFRGGGENKWIYRIPKSELDRVMRFDMEQMIERIIISRENKNGVSS